MAQWIRRGLWLVLALSFVWACVLVYGVRQEALMLQHRPGCASAITKPLVLLLNVVVPIAAGASIALVVLNVRFHRRQWAPLLAILIIVTVAERALWLLYPFFAGVGISRIAWWFF